MTKHKSGAQMMSENVWLTLLGRFCLILGVPLIILLASWELGKQDAIQTAVTQLQQKMDDVSKDPYHGKDAIRDFALRDYMIKSNIDNISDLKARVNTLETESANRHK